RNQSDEGTAGGVGVGFTGAVLAVVFLLCLALAGQSSRRGRADRRRTTGAGRNAADSAMSESSSSTRRSKSVGLKFHTIKANPSQTRATKQAISAAPSLRASCVFLFFFVPDQSRTRTQLTEIRTNWAPSTKPLHWQLCQVPRRVAWATLAPKHNARARINNS